ncbi:MAG TPA: S53 family peptidase [Solirubrobacteraceae bacterium]|nr:S53 family peptidase [Solirubrobacteraceae bacterium]
MRCRHSLTAVFAAMAVAAVPAAASAAPASHPADPPHPVHAKASKPPAGAANSKAKAYGRYCQGESKRHVAGTKGTPFSQCVTAMAKLANGRAATPKAACASLSKHHVKGMKGTPYSECIKGAAKLKHALKAKAAQATAAPLAVSVPNLPSLRTSTRDSSTACDLPDGSFVSYYHCYTPQQIRAAYGVDGVAPLPPSGAPNRGQGQTIVLVDAYGSPTAAQDLQQFHKTFFSDLPNPDFTELYPQGNPPYKNCGKSSGLSGPCAAAGWTGEATLDIEWAYSIAPEAHLVLLAVPPAETEGVQGLPNLMKAISNEVDATPSGTVFSMSFGVSEQSFGGAGAVQTAKFDQVFAKGIAKGDNFFSSSGDYGSTGTAKQAKETRTYANPSVGWPASSPDVVAVGGTQLQDGWTWNPASNDAFTASGAFNPAYWQWKTGGDSQAVWNESWGPIATGGGASSIYSRPAWQQGVDPGYGNHRLVPDTAWNAAVNGGVDVYITAYPQYNCGNDSGCWTIYGGTSAASPQTAALTALANAARKAAGKAPLGFLDPILYGGVGASSSDYTDIVPAHYGTAPQSFTGSDVGIAGPVTKSVGDLVDNQLWESSVPGYPTTIGYDATTGWGTPQAASFVAALTAMP